MVPIIDSSSPGPAECSDLCIACGMCCNGVMFHTVELQAGDSPRAIASLGVKLKRKAGKVYIQQPCPAFKASCCSVYAQRPERCQLFECRQLIGVKAGEIPLAEAREKIRAATALAARLVAPGGLFERLGETNDRKPLAKRFNNIMADPLEPDADPALIAAREEMVAIMAKLDALLDTSFRVNRNESADRLPPHLRPKRL